MPFENPAVRSGDRPSAQSVETMDQLLAHYVAGNLPTPLNALVGAHVEIREDGRKLADSFEILAGRELESIQPQEFQGRDQMLAAVFSTAAPALTAKRESPACPVFPKSLIEFTGHTVETIPWRNKLPGLKEFRVARTPGFDAHVYWIRAGRAMPHHTHGGSELTLVLEGGFADGLGHYLRGDVAAADETVDHRPVADDDKACICFAVTTAPLKMTGSFRQLFSDIFGR